MKLVDLVQRQIRTLLGRGVFHRARYIQAVRFIQVSPRQGFTLDDIEHIEPYGFTSHPRAGAEAILASLGGNRDRTIALMIGDRRHRIPIEEGESALYTDTGAVIHLKLDGSIHIKAGTKVLLDAPETELTGDLNVGGDVHIAGVSYAADHDSDGISGNEHQHPGDSGGTTGEPL